MEAACGAVACRAWYLDEDAGAREARQPRAVPAAETRPRVSRLPALLCPSGWLGVALEKMIFG